MKNTTPCLIKTEEKKPKEKDIVFLIMITGVENHMLKYGIFKAKVLLSKRGLNENDFYFEAITETGRKQLVEFGMESIGEAVFFKESDAKEALAKLEKEEGLMYECRIKPGDRVFIIDRGNIIPKDIVKIEINTDGVEYVCWGFSFTNKSVGKTVFLTETDAETVLKKLEGGEQE